MRYSDWVRWLRSSGEESPLLRAIARTLLGAERDRVNGADLYQSMRRVRMSDGSVITVGFLNGQPYAHIEGAPALKNHGAGSTCGIYMQTGLVDASAGTTLYPPSDATCATIVAGLTTDAFLNITTDGAGRATITGRCDGTTTFAGFSAALVAGVSYTEAQKRTAQKRVPASMFSGLLAVYVQALYGAKGAAYRLASDGKALEVALGDGSHVRLRWAPGTPASNEITGLVKIAGDYYFVGYGAGATAYYRPLRTDVCYNPLRTLLKAYSPQNATDQAALDRFESFYLSVARPSATVTNVTVSGAVIASLSNDPNSGVITDKYGTTYGAQFSRRAPEASYVYQGRRITATFSATGITAVENENVSSFLELRNTPFFPSINSLSADGSTIAYFDVQNTFNEDSLPTSVDAPVWVSYDPDGTQKILRYSCELAVAADSLAFAALDVACAAQTFYPSSTVNSCGDTVLPASGSNQIPDVVIGFDYCEQSARTRSGPLSRVINWSAGFYTTGNTNVASRPSFYVYRNGSTSTCTHSLRVARQGYPALFAETANFPTPQTYSGSHTADAIPVQSADGTITNSTAAAGGCGYCGTTTVVDPSHPDLASCTVVMESLDYYSGYPDVYTVFNMVDNAGGVIRSVCFFPWGAASTYALSGLDAKYCIYTGGKLNPPTFLQPTWPGAHDALGNTIPIFSTPVTNYVNLRSKYHFECTQIVGGGTTSYVSPTHVTTSTAPTAYAGFAAGAVAPIGEYGASNVRTDVTMKIGFSTTAVGSGYATLGAKTTAAFAGGIPPSLGFTYTDYVNGTVPGDYSIQDHVIIGTSVRDMLPGAVVYDSPVLGKPYLVQSLRGDTIALADFLRPGSAAYSASGVYPSLPSPSFVGWA